MSNDRLLRRFTIVFSARIEERSGLDLGWFVHGSINDPGGPGASKLTFREDGTYDGKKAWQNFAKGLCKSGDQELQYYTGWPADMAQAKRT